MDCGSGSPISDDPFSLSALLNLDGYPELFSPSSAVQVFSPFSSSSDSTLPQVPSNWANGVDGTGKNPAQKASGNYALTSNDVSEERRDVNLVPKSLPGTSLAEKMLKALYFFKGSSGGGILAQVWMPIKNDNVYVLSTLEQPFLLDQMLAGYREVSRAFTFSAEEAPGLFPGLPGRVFISGMPEWTSNVVYYNRFEYLRADYAASHEVRGSLAVPVFPPTDRSCCAVLELVTTKEKSNFDSEMEIVCSALEAVNLRTIRTRAHQQQVTRNQKFALTEIMDVLRACCHAHMLPLALTWVPFLTGESVTKLANSNSWKKELLFIQESACYVNDLQMEGFLHACSEYCLEKGQGIAGKAFKSIHPFFSPDIKGYDIREYPLAHHARKFGLHAAVAIRLRSTYTGNNDYILEFFLPVKCIGSSEQQELLNNLSSTMQRICTSLRTVSDAEAAVANTMNAGINIQKGTSSTSPDISIEQSQESQQMDCNNELPADIPFEHPKTGADERGDTYHDQIKSHSTKHSEKKRSTVEKNISLSELQQYFSGSLKDAAKSIGVCPTTLKRICRQHEISRWPSRKINKVNRSLKKIQTVINSVQGVEGALKYDPSTGCLVAAVCSPKKPTPENLQSGNQGVMPLSSPSVETELHVRKLELDDSSVPTHRTNVSDHSNTPKRESESARVLQNECQIVSKSADSASIDVEMTKEHSQPSSSSMTDSSSGSASSFPRFRKSASSSALVADSGTIITVKATYKDDTVRFKFQPSMGCQHLFGEISRRYNLLEGAFHLKYMDDEEEWVVLACDSDLHECIEVLASMGSQNLRLLVRDTTCIVGSSDGSSL